MKDRRKKIILFVFTLVVLLGFMILMMGVLFRGDESDRLEEASTPLIAIGGVTMLIGVVPVITVMIMLASKNIARSYKMIHDVYVKNEFFLKVYASKNFNYYYKEYPKTKRSTRSMKEIERAFFDDRTACSDVEIYDKDWINSNLGHSLVINDARKITQALYLEILYENFIVYANVLDKRSGLIIFKQSEIKERYELNSGKKAILLESTRIIDGMDKIFDKINNEKRIISKDVDENINYRMTIEIIKEEISKFENYDI